VPVQLASFAAGAAGMGVPAFLAAALAGRTLRYAAMGVMVYAFGPAIADWWRRRSRALRTLAGLGVLLVFAALLISALAAFLPSL
jgi:membrane protein DedA with SNARE-associated domain